jgi:DNA-binding Xre family transcriptional regulator
LRFGVQETYHNILKWCGVAKWQHLKKYIPEKCHKILKKGNFSGKIKVDILYINSNELNLMNLMNRRSPMKVRYDKLWRKMKDNELKKSELAKAADISAYAMTKLNHDLPVTMEVMMNLCKVFHCDIGDLMEVIEE